MKIYIEINLPESNKLDLEAVDAQITQTIEDFVLETETEFNVEFPSHKYSIIFKQ